MYNELERIFRPLPAHITRANPFPKVTDLFCRLPLPTLFYQLEALHLEDLLRLSVRPVAKAITSPGFSRTVTGAPDSTKCTALPVGKPSRQLNCFQGPSTVKKKRKLFPEPAPASPSSYPLPSTPHNWFRNFKRIPFRPEESDSSFLLR